MNKKFEFRIPSFIQLFMLVLQTVYLILFYGDIFDFTDNLAHHFEKMIVFVFATTLIAFVAYWVGFFRNSVKERIVFSLLLLFHFAVAYYSFYLTVATIISRC